MKQFFATKIRKGPKEDRKCFDCFCVVIFSAFVVALLFFVATITSTGNVSSIGMPMDSSLNICGQGSATDYSKLFFPESASASVCIKTCPSQQNGITDCLVNKQYKTCPANSPTTLDPKGLCLPVNDPPLRKQVDRLLQAVSTDYWTSLPRSYPQLLEGAAVEIAVGVIVSMGMLVFPTAFILVFYLAGLGLVLGLAIIFLYQQVNHKLPYLDVKVQEAPVAYIVCTVAFSLLALFMLGYLLIRINRLTQLSKFVNIGSAFFRSNFTALFNSILWSGVLLLFFYGWASALVCLVADTENGPYTGFVPAGWRQTAPLSLVVMGIALLWVRGTIISLSEFIISAQSIFWYCKKQTCFQSYRNALVLTFRYHLGSIIFAGLTVANLPHRLLSWVRQSVQSKKQKEDQQCGLGVTLACCGCCYLLSDLSHFYHIEAVLSSQNFQTSSKYFVQQQQVFRSYENRGLYRMGVFASNAMKLTLCTLCAACTYLFLAFFQPTVLQGQQALAMLLLGLVVGQGIADIMSHHLLLSGQVLIFCYLIDRIVEEKDYGLKQAHSCPQAIAEYVKAQVQ